MTVPSVDACRPRFPRWRSRLAVLGVEGLPPFPATTSAEVAATNDLLLLIKQGANTRDPSGEHNLRNLTAIRPYKP